VGLTEAHRCSPLRRRLALAAAAATGCPDGVKKAGALALYWLVRRGCGSSVRFRSPLARGAD